MSLAVSALYLLLTIVIIFGVAWVICWLLQTFVKAVPAQVQNFIYIVAAILAIIKVVVWLGGVGNVFAAEAPHHVARPSAIHEHVDRGHVIGGTSRRYEPGFVTPRYGRRLRGCDRVLLWRCW